MDFNFADISSAYMEMAPGRMPGQGGTGGNTAGSQKGVFADQLNTTMNGKSADTDIPEQATTRPQPAPDENAGFDAEKVMQFLSRAAEQENAPAFAASLKKVFLALSGGDLKHISLDESGMGALKKLLVKAGFSQEDIESLIADLKQENEESEISLGAFLDGVFDLPVKTSEEADEESAYLESSARPFIESILFSLGVPETKIEQILSGADQKDAGLDLNQILKDLENLHDASSRNGTGFQSSAADKNISDLLTHLENSISLQGKQDLKETDNAPRTLSDVIRVFENIRKEISEAQPAAQTQAGDNLPDSGERTGTLLETMLKGLKTVSPEDGQSRMSGFHADQISEKMQAAAGKSMIKESVENAGKDSADETKAGMKDAAKLFEAHAESSLSGDKNGSGEKESRGGNTERVTRETRPSDLAQAGTAQNRASDTSSAAKVQQPVRNLPAHVTYQVEKSIVRAVNQGENVLKIQLKPPELGRLMMTIEHTGKALKVSVVTETPAAREILAANTSEIKSALSNSGVNLERFDVDMNSDFRQSMANTGHQDGNQSKRRKGGFRQQTGAESLEQVGSRSLNGPAPNTDGSLHYVA